MKSKKDEPPGRDPEPPVEQPPRRRRGPHEVPDPPPIDNPEPPQPERIVQASIGWARRLP